MSILPSLDYNHIVKQLLLSLREITGIPAALIYNMDSVRGADIFRPLNENECASPTLNDVFAVFSLDENPDGEYAAGRISDERTEVITSYTFSVHFYGYPSHDKAQQTQAGFRTARIAGALRDAGVYITGVTGIQSVKEFVNNTLWPRCDVTVHLTCRNEFVSPDADDVESFTDPVSIYKI